MSKIEQPYPADSLTRYSILDEATGSRLSWRNRRSSKNATSAGSRPTLRVVAVAPPDWIHGKKDKRALNSSDPASLFNACRVAASRALSRTGAWANSNWAGETRSKVRANFLLLYSLDDIPAFIEIMEREKPNVLLLGAMTLCMPGAIEGNQHDVVDVFAYATEGSLDATMWQNNERKARFIAAALSGDTSIRRLEDMVEGQASQFAMAKAIASGDQRLMQKAGLEADIARLERLRAAHIDDQHAVRRQIRDAERDIDYSARRIAEVGQDIDRRVPTTGEAFAMTVTGRSYTDRKAAGRVLMKEILTLLQLQQEGQSVIASIGGFDLEYSGERFGKDGYRYCTTLLRSGVDHEIELPVTVTPLGAVSRLEHALDSFEGDRERYRQRLADARRRLASYQSREGGVEFAFAGELADKRRQLEEVEVALAADIEVAGDVKATAT